MSLKRRALVAAALSALLVPHGSALAHAMLERASPAVGSTVAAAPKEVVLFFSSSLEPVFSNIEVRDADGAPMQTGKATVDSKQPAQMRVPLKALAAGTYRVIWRVLSVDSHRSQGDFRFTVGK